MSDAAGALLGEVRSVLVVDWPSPEVPESLARAGRSVFVKGGPGPRDFAVRELADNGALVSRPLGEAPTQVDLVYAHRPLDELDTVLGLARSLGARAIWWQSGLSADGARDPRGCWLSSSDAARAREAAEAAGVTFVSDVYIVDAVVALDG